MTCLFRRVQTVPDIIGILLFHEQHALDPIYAKAIGVDVDELLISQPDTGEQALEITDMLVRSGALAPGRWTGSLTASLRSSRNRSGRWSPSLSGA